MIAKKAIFFLLLEKFAQMRYDKKVGEKAGLSR